MEVGYEGGMAEFTRTLAEILTATFGPVVSAEVMKDEAAEVVKDDAAKASGSSPVGDDGAVVATSDLPKWWKHNLDGTPRKTCQAPVVQTGYGTTRRHETDTAVLEALHGGAESLVQVMTVTGYVKVTCTRSLERLVEEGRVLQTKAPPSGRRGRPAHLYRPTTEVAEPVEVA